MTNKAFSVCLNEQRTRNYKQTMRYEWKKQATNIDSMLICLQFSRDEEKLNWVIHTCICEKVKIFVALQTAEQAFMLSESSVI